MSKTNWLAAVLLLSNSAHAGWVEEWFDNAAVSSPSSYENQQRGFYSAGGFQARTNLNTDYPVTVNLPKIDAGCGGIDLFLGGLSLLDEDYLVEKFQNIIQAAPALAFDIALKTMSKELSETMNKLEATTNWLNSLQLDDCAISNTVVTAVANDDPDVLGKVWGEITAGVSLEEAIAKNYQQSREQVQANDNSPTVSLMDQVSECSAQFQAIFSEGSVVEHAATLMGLEAMAPIIRGYIGDVEIEIVGGEYPVSTRIERCPGNNPTNIDDFLSGTAQQKADLAGGGLCTDSDTTSLTDIVADNLTGISGKMIAKAPLSAAEEAFINNSPIPVYSILRKAVAQQNVPMTVSMMTDVVAAAYAYRIFDDLYRNTDYMFDKVDSISSSPGVDAGGTTKCDTSVFADSLAEFARLHEVVRGLRGGVRDSYRQSVQEFNSHLEFARRHQEEEQRIRRARTLDIRDH